MKTCFYPDWGNCEFEKCPMYVERKCKAAAMEEIAEKINAIFPNVECYVEDGFLQIHADIVDNANVYGPFQNAATLYLTPSPGRQAVMLANIYPVDDAPLQYRDWNNMTCTVKDSTQKWMIDPENFLKY